MKKFHIGFGNHFIQSWHILIHATVFFLFPWYFKLQYGDESVDFAYKAALYAFLIVFIPHMILHLRYWWINHGMAIEFKKNTISLSLRDRNFDFKYSDIEFVELVESNASANNTLQWFPWDSYSYAKLCLSSGEVVVVTSLLVPHLKIPFKLPRTKLVKATFCWPSKLK
ncbi:hypothetical protein MIB92_18770 [Aestuariirhabdus sp. Z084]|uniref:hypothetical protein n=1 Tax=Aestuariirhabdus haliotis TaxID=2918751 RepID=UPI00201B3B50|nr:hypothetical protein [Aestuariirhabdus haliotis]MCL6417710.1 hypothetical protein [Aestuariirhabdus haliotis]MCL6421659.1 hypothetical protein [Aestuariirhabdus haliotis]